MEIKKGKFLIADPSMEDPIFFKSVILIVHCDLNETIGLIINQPSSIKITEILDVKLNNNIYMAGPVEKNSLQFIHKLDTEIPNSNHIYDNLYWGGDFEYLKNFINHSEKNINNIRFFSGYSGWKGDQLLKEIEEKSWIVVDSSINQCFENKRNIWSDIVKDLSPDHAIWTNLPYNPHLN